MREKRRRVGVVVRRRVVGRASANIVDDGGGGGEDEDDGGGDEGEGVSGLVGGVMTSFTAHHQITILPPFFHPIPSHHKMGWDGAKNFGMGWHIEVIYYWINWYAMGWDFIPLYFSTLLVRKHLVFLRSLIIKKI